MWWSGTQEGRAVHGDGFTALLFPLRDFMPLLRRWGCLHRNRSLQQQQQHPKKTSLNTKTFWRMVLNVNTDKPIQSKKKSTLCNFLLQNIEDILKNVVNQKVLVHHSLQIYQQSNQIPSKIKEFQSKKFCLLLAAIIRTKQYNQRQSKTNVVTLYFTVLFLMCILCTYYSNHNN